MVFAEHDHAVQTLPPKASDHALRIRILPRTARRREHWGHAQARHALLKDLAIRPIAVPEYVLRSRLPGEGRDQMLGRPLGGRMRGHIDVRPPWLGGSVCHASFGGGRLILDNGERPMRDLPPLAVWKR